MKKGFTIIEVLAVITLIAILTVIIMPNILNSVNNEKEGVSDSAKQIIYDATDIYMKDNSEIYTSTEGLNYCIKLETLVNSGKLVSPIKDMKKDKEVPLNYYVKATVNEYNQFDYELVDNNNCEEKNPIEIIYKIPTGYAKSKKVTLTFPSGNFIKKYKILSGTTEENIELNKEFITDKEEVNLTFKSNGKLEAILLNKETNDEITKKTIEINKIDNNNPTITNSKIDKFGKITYTIADSESGLKDYCINNTNSIDNCEWIKINNYPLKYTFTYIASKANDYYIHIRDKFDNTYISKSPLKITNSNLCQYDINKTWEFSYTGNEQTFTVPCTGKYKLETWGAQGGSVTGSGSEESYIGGYGGYSIGSIQLNNNTLIYINVGGQGILNSNSNSTLGGFNGGAVGIYNGGSGGGATHIANTSGLLSSLSSNRSAIIMVAGGGGGGAFTNISNYSNGGSGGGHIGTDSNTNIALDTYDCYRWATGGTQTAGGNTYHYVKNIASATTRDGRKCANFIDQPNLYLASFGTGAKSDLTSSSYGAGGGGGGFYGGGASSLAGAGGGSGYIGNTSLTNKAMYCYNCTESSDTQTKTISTTNVSSTATANYAKIGNGYARITYLGD